MASSVVLDIDSMLDCLEPATTSNNTTLSHLAHQMPTPNREEDESEGGEGENQNESTANTNTADMGRLMVDNLEGMVKSLYRVLPFLVILLLKLLYDHSLGIGMFIGSMFVCSYANKRIKRQTVLTMNSHSRVKVMLLIAILAFHVLCILYTFYPHHLYRGLIFLLPHFSTINLWTLLWILFITDFMVKCLTMICKAVVMMLPISFLKFKYRGSYYYGIEVVSQFYRSLLPVSPWFNYLLSDPSESYVFSTILVVIYCVFKSAAVLFSASSLHRTFLTSLKLQSYGSSPTPSEIRETGDVCPICQDAYTEPVQMPCKHIFCDDCIRLWFDRERTCPMCRKAIVSKPNSPVWRDGATSMWINLY